MKKIRKFLKFCNSRLKSDRNLLKLVKYWRFTMIFYDVPVQIINNLSQFYNFR